MSQAKKIMLLDTGNEWGGGTNSMIELLKRIDRSRFAITCVFYKDYRKGRDGRRLSEELAAIGIPLLVLPQSHQPWWAKLAKELARGLLIAFPDLRQRAVRAVDHAWRIEPRAAKLEFLLRDGQYDLLYMNNQPSTNLEGYLAAERLGIPVVQHCRIKPTLFPDQTQLVNRLARRIICVSESIAAVLHERGITPALTRVVHNAIDVDQPLPAAVALDLPANRPVIGTVGRLISLKSIDHLIEAVARLKKEGVLLTCLILGEGHLREALLAQTRALDVVDEVRFVGFQEVPLAWIQRMDICVLCSSNEGLPRVALEAMLIGHPVVGSRVMGTQDIVVDGETGLLYPYGDIPALTEALRTLLCNESLRQRLGAAGKRRIHECFTIGAYVRQVSAVLADSLP